MLPRWIFVGALWLLFSNSVAFSQRTSIKINDGDPKPAAGAGAASAAGANAGTPYGYGAGSTLGRGAGARGTWQSAPPPLFRPPNPPSGPQSYQALAGQCFQMKTGQYQYEMCPFQNVTQRAASLAPGSLYVILGVWGEWEMNGLQRVAMIYTDGTACASGTRRQVKALLECGDAPRIHDVTEPSTCHYEIHFAHPAACPHSSEQTQTQEQAAQTGSTPESTESSTTISPPQQQEGSQEGSAVVMEAQPTAGQSCPELTAELTAVKRELTMNQATSNRMRSCIMVLAGILSDATSLTEADTTVCSEFLVA